ncbi:hypothetical protein vseg_001367 [Gypsophila vaccaria]
MESVALSFTSSPLILGTISSRARAVGLNPESSVLNVANSKRPVVRRAQKYDGEPRRDTSQTPSAKPLDPHRLRSFFETSRFEPTSSWKMEEKDDYNEMWLKMPGVGVQDINVYVKDNRLYIQERNDITPFRRMMIQPFDSIQLPPDSKKEDIVAKLGNGILYIYVPKASKHERAYDVPVENVSW